MKHYTIEDIVKLLNAVEASGIGVDAAAKKINPDKRVIILEKNRPTATLPSQTER